MDRVRSVAVMGLIAMSSRMQALKRPGATSRSGGTVAAQASIAYGQRVRNTQPEGGSTGLGMSPCSRRRSRRASGSGRGDAASSASRVGMQRRRVQRLRRRDFHHLAEVEHDDAVAQVLDDVEIVRDEQHRQAEALAQVGQQVDHLRLDRHVERRHRLVGDDELRLDRERARDADALALAAGELVRKAPRVLGREADERQQLGDPRLARAARVQAVRRQRLVQRVADAPARIQARVRVLEDDLQAAAIGAHARAPTSGARSMPSIPHSRRRSARSASARAADRALARARFADQAEHLALGGSRS